MLPGLYSDSTTAFYGTVAVAPPLGRIFLDELEALRIAPTWAEKAVNDNLEAGRELRQFSPKSWSTATTLLSNSMLFRAGRTAWQGWTNPSSKSSTSASPRMWIFASYLMARRWTGSRLQANVGGHGPRRWRLRHWDTFCSTNGSTSVGPGLRASAERWNC